MSRLLDVYLKDRKAGELMQDDDASLTFTYDGDYLATDPAALSVSLPLQDVVDEKKAQKRHTRTARISAPLRRAGNECRGTKCNLMHGHTGQFGETWV